MTSNPPVVLGKLKAVLRVAALLLALTAALSLVPVGCRQLRIWDADRATAPIIQAIETYRNANGVLPSELDDLPPQVNRRTRLKIQGLSSGGVIWTMGYRVNPDGSYLLSFFHVHYTVEYPNGRRGDVRFQFFK